jgi:hypothetical protein
VANKKAISKTDLLSCYKRVFGTDDGKRVLNDLIKQYYLMVPTFGRVFNSELMLVREGQRSVILSILRSVNIDVSKLRDRMEQITKDEEYYE